MSVSASIDFKLHQKYDDLSNLDVIELLYKNGWTFNDNGQSCFVPFGAEIGDFELRKIDADVLFKILEAKQDAGEYLSVVMTWQNTNIGFTLLTHEHLGISVLLNINRQITVYKVTDFMWYLDRIIPCFEDDEWNIVQLFCSEIR